MTRLTKQCLIFIIIIISYSLFARSLFELSPKASQLLFELPFFVILYLLFDGIQKNKQLGLFIYTTLVILFYLGHDIFYQTYSHFPRFSDFDSVGELLEVLPQTLSFSFWISIAAIVGLLVWNVKLMLTLFDILKLTLLLICIWTLYQPPDWTYRLLAQHIVIDSFEEDVSLKKYGRFTMMFFRHTHMNHARSRLLARLSGNANNGATPGFGLNIQDQRNIYVIVLESFLDPRLLQNLGVIESPYNSLENIYTGQPAISISPVFAGGTPNAEFEILCGLPSLGYYHSLEFELFTGEETQCLPTILRDHGYLTMASHPYKAATFNRALAYKGLGFEQRLFSDKTHSMDAKPILMDDVDGIWLFDGSLYQQNLVEIKRLLSTGQPFFNYVLTAGGHYPFELNETKRPKVVKIDAVDETALRLTNHYYYRSNAVFQYIREIQALDPNAYIVAVSDHLPPKLNYEALGYHAAWNGNPALSLKENLLFLMDRGEWKNPGVIRHKDIFYYILNALTNDQYCIEHRCNLGDLGIANGHRYLNTYDRIMRQAMQ